jgi:hypothetical protein
MTIALMRPLVLRRNTSIEISVTEPGYVGRFVDYAFRRRADEAVPYAIDHGCINSKGAHQVCS